MAHELKCNLAIVFCDDDGDHSRLSFYFRFYLRAIRIVLLLHPPPTQVFKIQFPLKCVAESDSSSALELRGIVWKEKKDDQKVTIHCHLGMLNYANELNCESYRI